MTLKNVKNFKVWKIKEKQYEVKVAELADCIEYKSQAKRKLQKNVLLSTIDCDPALKVETSPSEKFRIQSFLHDI